MRYLARPAVVLLLTLLPFAEALAQLGIPAITVATGADGEQTWSMTLQVLLLMTLLSMLPAALIMMTAFTRIVIVLGILRQGMGTQQTPSNQIIIGIALFLTFFIMAPVFERVYNEALKPYMEETLSAEEALQTGMGPMREFMLAQTRESDLALFARISGRDGFETADEIPFSLLVPSFVTSELKTAFQMGFVILLPFLIIDLVVACVLMSMGMMMLPPIMISLPFKIILFVLVDGWPLIMGTLASSFYF